MKKQYLIVIVILTLTIASIQSCGKQETKGPLKETQIYGSANHLSDRELLSFLPQPDAIALVAPSIKNILNTVYKVDSLSENKVTNHLKNIPKINTLIKEDQNKTLEYLQSLGINVDKPCAFFYTLNDKWEAVLPIENLEPFSKTFPDAKKTTLKTSWYWFISGKYSANWDSKESIGFMSYKGYTLCSNDIEIMTQTVLRENNPPSFNYGLNGKPILSPDETVAILSISDDLKEIINNPDKPFEPSWLKALILTLDKDYDEICAIINPENDFHEIALSIHSKQNPSTDSPTPELKFANYLPDNQILTLDLALTDGIKNFIPQLAKQDKTGKIKKKLGPASGIMSSPLFYSELSIGVLTANESAMPNIVLITMCQQIQGLKSLIALIAAPGEPVKEFETLVADLKRPPINIPLTLYIGLKDPYVLVADNKDRLVETIEKISQPSQIATPSPIQTMCPFGYIKSDTTAIKALLDSNLGNLKIENIETISKILPNIPEVCLYNDGSWYLMKIKATI
ncbi:MAG TPA: hypothetical protein PLX23_05385 [Candidatus Hydrogenedens sp.]|nr:hypothetical protein [Candidatus Hydrogenedens sp.]